MFYQKNATKNVSLPIWRTIFVSIVSLYTIRVYLWFYAYESWICWWALGSWFYCNSIFFDKVIIHPEILMIWMFLFWMPLVLPIISLIYAFWNCRLARESTNKYSTTYFYLNLLFIVILLPIIVLILWFILSIFLMW